jgi:hypothetical protein
MNIPTARQSGILCRLLAIVNSARENQRFAKSDMKRYVEEPGAITNREIVSCSQDLGELRSLRCSQRHLAKTGCRNPYLLNPIWAATSAHFSRQAALAATIFWVTAILSMEYSVGFSAGTAR